jgi:hypothetical protein
MTGDKRDISGSTQTAEGQKTTPAMVKTSLATNKKAKISPYVYRHENLTSPKSSSGKPVLNIKTNDPASSEKKEILVNGIAIPNLSTGSLEQPESKTPSSSPLSKPESKYVTSPIGKYFKNKKSRGSFRFAMDPLRNLKSPNALTPRCAGYTSRPKLKSGSAKTPYPQQRRPSMKFTLDPLRKLNYLKGKTLSIPKKGGFIR